MSGWLFTPGTLVDAPGYSCCGVIVCVIFDEIHVLWLDNGEFETYSHWFMERSISHQTWKILEG